MRRGWMKFLLAFFIVTAGVQIVAWFMGPQGVVGSLGAVVVVILAWPLLVFLLGLGVGVLAGLCSGDSGPTELAEGGVKACFWYYPRLFKSNKPVFWGSIAAVSLSTVGLYLYVERAIRPMEVQARQQLVALAEKLKDHHRREGKFPECRGLYLYEALDLSLEDTWGQQSLHDPWRRPIRYNAGRMDEADWFEVASTGWNGKPEPSGGDDIIERGVKVKPLGFGKKLLKGAAEKLVDHLKKK